jgi:eukaryotic-like serine/threonine-protein kinase
MPLPEMPPGNPWQPRWQATVLLGQGSTGATYLAHDPNDPSRVGALKVLIENGNPDCRRRLHLEAQTLAALSSPRVPRLLDSNHQAFEGLAPLYLAMEYVPGPTLQSHLASQGILPLSRGVRLLSAILDGVEHCHGNGVVHRDINPDNILLREGQPEDPVLIDFGASCDLRSQANPRDRDHYVGNRFVLLPELRGFGTPRSDPRSDLTMCVGLLLFALTGMKPLALRDEQGRSPEERPEVRAALQMIIGGPALERLRYVFARAFWPDIRYRWQSPAQLRATIQEVAAGIA